MDYFLIFNRDTLKHMNTEVILNTFSVDDIMPEMLLQMFLIFM